LCFAVLVLRSVFNNSHVSANAVLSIFMRFCHQNSIVVWCRYLGCCMELITQWGWPRLLKPTSKSARLLGWRIRIPPGVWPSLSSECCVLSGRSLNDGPIPRLEESYRVWVCHCVCSGETITLYLKWVRRRGHTKKMWLISLIGDIPMRFCDNMSSTDLDEGYRKLVKIH